MFMYKYISLLMLTLICPLVSTKAQDRGVSLSFEEALQVMNGDNKSLEIADYEIGWAKEERQRMNALWYPNITATGAYTHFSNKIEVRQSLSPLTGAVKDFVQSIDPKEQLITGFLDQLGSTNLSFPLMPQNATTVDALITYPLFTGGKRISASKIGKQLEKVAQVSKQKISAEQQVLLVQTYFGVRLSQRVVDVKQETYKTFEKHYQNALKLEANGMITKAERLMFEVNRNEAKRDLEVSQKDLNMAQSAFRNLVKIDTEQFLIPTTSMFINHDLPALSYFKEMISSNNYSVSALKIQKNIQDEQIKIAKSAYVPNIELLGKQTLYSHGIDKYLVPRSMIGVGFTWNIFDGLDREKKIRQSKIQKDIIETQQEKAIDDLKLAVDQFYTQTQTALDNVTALKTTIEMSKELVRTRQKAFTEGMATSTEVIDAELMLSKVRLASLLSYYQFDMGLMSLLSICGIPESFSEYSKMALDEKQILN